MATLASPPRFAVSESARGRLTLASPDGAHVHLCVLEKDVIRVSVLPSGKWNFPKTWTIAPGAEDVPAEGRARDDLSGFTLPDFRLDNDGETLCLETASIRLIVKLAGFFCSWEIKRDGVWHKAAKDRPTQAYNFGWWGERVHHCLARDPAEKYFGLGERTGEMDRAGRRFRLANLDALGYSARTSDPLYKHIPFYVTWKPEAKIAFGLFYDTLSDCVFDFGCERDNYHGLYRSFVAEHGDLDYYFISGPSLGDVTRRLTWLTGKPAFLPRWSLGYSGSTMSYTDAPDAQARMAEFLAQCERHDILCDSFHLSSGYTSIGPKRYVFHWNREKFPDPSAFAARYAGKGVHLVPNIKPCLLADHPLFAEACEKGLLVAEADGAPHWVQFWDAIGAYLDFTNPATLVWWKEKVSEALLEKGLDSTWNDNNEFEIASPRARMHGFGEERPAQQAKPLHTLLMMRASREAQVAHRPGLRPFVVTRAGCAGMQRYAQTWSGDNSTSWETLKYNIKMGLGLALSGVSNSGHDVGGFAGPAPDAELFLHWVQCGIFLPRFSIHSWNDDGSVNEPWMHPEITKAVSALIKLRARLAPYMYDLLWRHHAHFEPVIRPTFLDFPEDSATFCENDEFLLGPSLLVAPVVEPGASARAVTLPRGSNWTDFWTDETFAGGETVTREVSAEQPVLFARAGSFIPLNVAEQHFAKPAYELAVRLFPPRGEGIVETSIFEDDGESENYRSGACRITHIRAECDGQGPVKLAASWSGRFALRRTDLRVLLPRGRELLVACPMTS